MEGSEVVLSAIVPLKDEAESVAPLHVELVDALNRIGVAWEIVYVDDGSTDGSDRVLAGFAAADTRVRVIPLDRNYGQSTATVAGAEAARGRWLATLDADGQNDPADLVDLWRELRETRADVIQGVRHGRADSWMRRASSWIANRVRNRLTGDPVTDVGCSLRIMPREAFLAAPRFEGMHRFLPTLLRMVGATVVERSVSHRPRRAGATHYGIGNRLWTGLADLLMVRRLRKRWVRYEVSGVGPETRPSGSGKGPPANAG